MSAPLPVSRIRHSPSLPGRAASARALDKFYTRADIARDCVAFFEAETGHDLDRGMNDIIEPSAGSGAFLDALPARTLGYDLDPEDGRVTQQDFLALERSDPAVVIGNPPFGKAARLAVRFFNTAAVFATHIGFIVPRSFEKASIQNRLDSRFHLRAEKRLPAQSFTFDGAPYDVPCIFQVWERLDTPRARLALPRTHPDFDFVPRGQADFAFQRVGVRAGALKTDLSEIAAASHHFLRARIAPDRLAAALRSIDFTEVKSRTAGNPSISKTELIALYAQQIESGSSECP
jgi:hypothetical protein